MSKNTASGLICQKKIVAKFLFLPKVVIFVDKIQRAPNGKADYKWANGVANLNDEK